MHSGFGDYLKHLRKRSGMSQHDLAAATGYSRSLISALEQETRLPDMKSLLQIYVPALGLQEEPHLVAQLVELAALARGERPPAAEGASAPLQERRLPEDAGDGGAYRMPLPPTALVGREREIDHLCRRMVGHHGRLLTLVGPPGVGKTRLAQAVGGALQRFYPDGAAFVSLAAVNDPARVAMSLQAALNLPHSAAQPPEVRLIEALRRKEMVLLLDNFEQVIDAAPLLAQLLAECAGLRLLVTSRERLHLRAEQRYRVPPLDTDAAVELFGQRASAVEADFALTAENRPLVEEICRKLDRLPLAIELCAAQLDLLSLPHLLAELQKRRLSVLVEGAADLPPQQRTLRHAIDQSYRLLNEEERRLFRCLGIFAGGFELAALEAIGRGNDDAEAQPIRATLHALIGKSLLYSAEINSEMFSTEVGAADEQRYWMLETIRDFALEEARRHEEEAELRRRHFAYYLQLFGGADRHLRGPVSQAWLARLKPELDNLRAALQWALAALERGETSGEDAAWLMMATSFFWNLAGVGYEEADWLARLLPYRRFFATMLRLTVLLTFYRAAFGREEYRPLEPFMAEIMQLLEECPYRLLHASTWTFRAWSARDAQEATANLERALAMTAAASDAPQLGAEFGAVSDRDFLMAICYLGYAAHLCDQGELAQATARAEVSLRLFQARGNRSGIGESLTLLGRLALLRNDLPQAERLLGDAAAIAMTLNFPAMHFQAQTLLAVAKLYGGDAAAARALLMESLRRHLDDKNLILLARVYTYLAATALREGAVEEAAQWLGQAVAAQQTPPALTLFLVEQLFVTASLATAQGRYLQAATIFGLAERAHREVHEAIGGPPRLWAAAALAMAREELDEAIFAEAFAVGHQLSLNQAFTTILAPGHLTGIRSGF